MMSHSAFFPSARPRLLLFPASLRRNSHQRRLIEYIAALLADRCAIDILCPGEVDLPLFNEDLQDEPAVLDRVVALHRRFAAADGLIIASPEYNGHVSPYLKNTVDWISRLPRIDARYGDEAVFRSKPLMLACASTGWTGGVLGLQSARALFSYLGCLVGPEQVCVSDADHWAASGAFEFEAGFADYIARSLEAFLVLVDKLVAVRPVEISARVA
jgi:chromate reductase, NAD(P)H dehydrogenase (quinone)